MLSLLRQFFYTTPGSQAMEAQQRCLRLQLLTAGLSERKLRKMDPDQRVAALERAHLDPYDYIYLAC